MARASPRRSISSKAYAPPMVERSSIDGLDVRRNRRAIQARIGVQLQATSLFEYLQVRETLRALRLLLSQGRRAGDAAARGGAGGEGACVSAGSLRWATPTPRAGPRAGQRSDAGLPRRANQRAGPAEPSPPLGAGPAPARARQDRRADHALHGRGADPLRPHRHHGPRAHHRAGYACRADRDARSQRRHRVRAHPRRNGRATLGG